MKCSLALLAVLLLGTALPLPAEIAEEAVSLRNLALAQLENEKPGEAEKVLRALIPLVPDDPLGYADLAIALLRQQRFDEAIAQIDKALDKSRQDPELLTIKGEILQWSGQPEKALEQFRSAAESAPENIEIQYALYRQASTLPPDQGEDLAGQALERMARLRPENLVVALHRGQRAIADNNRPVASASYLRTGELLWQAQPPAHTLHKQVIDALEANDLPAARVPALRLENVLKITAMYREGLRELTRGIQGVPLARFRDEPERISSGRPVAVKFRGSSLSTRAVAGSGLALGDFDGDQMSDLAWLVDGDPPSLEVRLSTADGAPAESLPAAGIERLLAADLDNDGWLDLIGYAPEQVRVWRGNGEGGFDHSTTKFGLDKAGAMAAAVIDFDIEGDLDLALAGGRSGSGELFRNNLSGPLEAVGTKSFPAATMGEVSDLVASDLDRDGDLDLLVTHSRGLTWLDNLRQGKFVDRTAAGGLADARAANTALSVDLDGDGLPDLVTAGRGLQLFHNRGGIFEPWSLGDQLRTTAEFSALAALDADNDGRLDLAAGGEAGLTVLIQRQGPKFEFLQIDQAPAAVQGLAVADLDHDCDLDLVTVGNTGLSRLENEGGHQNACLAVRLRGLATGSGKNNLLGFGATLEVLTGTMYQFREVSTDVTHFGLGQLTQADILRVVWTNGVPQNRLDVRANQWIVEEQILKGSCPFLYAWDGSEMRFVTDLLWGSPVGLPVAPGVWAGADPEELIKVEGAQAEEGIYELRVTEELWEAAFFDYMRLWVVDHPSQVEVASSLKILPGRKVPEKVLGTRDLRPVAAAWDGRGRTVTSRVTTRDEVYADGWRASPYQGIAAEPWAFTIDLGPAPAAPVRLHLDGWIFPTDASLNLAAAQRHDLEVRHPRLEAETPEGWKVVLPSMGHPAGKTKTMVVDVPTLPPGTRRLRIVSTQWLSWDRIAWSVAPADGEPLVRARLEPVVATLRYRGFSDLVRSAPNGPHVFDYSQARQDSPWLPFPGRYTRFGDVRELLQEPDDRSVILATGDELVLRFDASQLPVLPPGWVRTVFLESHGWDKDADRNTWEAQQIEPLPFRNMTAYPEATREDFPDTPHHQKYLETWLTRTVAGPEESR